MVDQRFSSAYSSAYAERAGHAAFFGGAPRGRGGWGGGGFRGGAGGRSAQFSSNRRLMDERGEFQGRRDQRRGGLRGGFRGGMRGGGRGGGWGGGRWEERNPATLVDPSIEVGEAWEFVAEMTVTQMSKMRYDKVAEGEDVVRAGSVRFYDRSLERINTRAARVLQKFPNRKFHCVTTTDDPIIRRLAGEGVANIFATSSIISLLMVAARTSYGWDIVVQRVGDKLFFDKREGSAIDHLTVGETSQEVQLAAAEDAKDGSSVASVKKARALAVEATATNQNFSQAVLRKDRAAHKFDEPDPFARDGEDCAAVGYRYRKWVFPDDVTVLVRCEVDAAGDGVSSDGTAPQLLAVKALSEYPEGTLEWRQKLDTHRGAVFANEIKNNAGKLARWTAQALLSGVDQINFGFTTRSNPRDGNTHLLLATQQYKPREFATQIALTPSNMWGVFMHIVDLCYRYMDETGKAIIMKDPNEPVVRMYRVPEDSFENDDDDDEDDEDDDGDDDEKEEDGDEDEEQSNGEANGTSGGGENAGDNKDGA
uniref:Eukaryotic translation initiation factor 3 subunit D n=1 Tax=Erythrolobus australicus TaxID=1077150 RepID=A0A7S1TKN4_9RHOD